MSPTAQSLPHIVQEANFSGTESSQELRNSSQPAGNLKTSDVGQDYSLPEACGQPISYVSDNVLPALWRVIYWTSQVLTWLVDILTYVI